MALEILGGRRPRSPVMTGRRDGKAFPSRALALAGMSAAVCCLIAATSGGMGGRAGHSQDLLHQVLLAGGGADGQPASAAAASMVRGRRTAIQQMVATLKNRGGHEGPGGSSIGSLARSSPRGRRHAAAESAALAAGHAGKGVYASIGDDNSELAKVLAKVDVGTDDLKIPTDLPLKDAAAVHGELRKLRDAARSLHREMRSIKKQDEDDVEVVSGASNRVAEDGSELQAAQGDEAASRKRVVDHELQVARQRLADAQAEEEAAAKAKAEADEAEEEAKEKHEVAAQDMKDAAEGRLAARRAREIARGSADAVDGVEKYAEKSAAAEEAKAQDEGFERTCTDVISVLGCGRLPKGSTCARFCGKGASNQGSADAKVRQGGSSSKSKSKSSSSERKEKKSGGSYVDSVYGKGYDPSTYTHDRKGFFTREPQARRDDQQAADEGALARMAYSRGGDVESNGLDSGEVWANSRLSEDGGGKLAKERAKENQLERELIREKAENEVLRGRVSGRGVEWPGDHSHPPLPQYSATEGTQQLASVYKQSAKQAWGGRAGEQANKEEEQVHRRSAKTSDGSLFDPFRP